MKLVLELRIEDSVVVVPILESLVEVIDAGAHAYLKQGETLHAKFVTVDGLFAQVSSYNINPRSERYEHEMGVNILDADLTRELDDEFASDIRQALKVERSQDLEIRHSPLSFIIRRYFFNQL